MSETRGEVTPLGRLISQVACTLDAAAFDDEALLRSALEELGRDFAAFIVACPPAPAVPAPVGAETREGARDLRRYAVALIQRVLQRAYFTETVGRPCLVSEDEREILDEFMALALPAASASEGAEVVSVADFRAMVAEVAGRYPEYIFREPDEAMKLPDGRWSVRTPDSYAASGARNACRNILRLLDAALAARVPQEGGET